MSGQDQTAAFKHSIICKISVEDQKLLEESGWEALKNEGNIAYKHGRFEEAANKYADTARLASPEWITRERFKNFLHGKHPRLGQSSPVQALEKEELENIFSFVKRDQGYFVNEPLAICHGNRSLMLMKLGRVEEAGKEADKALQHNPSYERGHERKIAFLEKTSPEEASLYSMLLKQSKEAVEIIGIPHDLLVLRTYFLLDHTGFEKRQALREQTILSFLQQQVSRNKERGVEGPKLKVEVEALLKEWGHPVFERGTQWVDINLSYLGDDGKLQKIMYVRSVKLKDIGGESLDEDIAFTTPDVVGKAVVHLKDFCCTLKKQGICINFMRISCGLMPLADAEHELYLDPRDIGVDIIPSPIEWRKYYTKKYPGDSNYMVPRWTRGGEERTGGRNTVYMPDTQHMMMELPRELVGMLRNNKELKK